MKPHCHRESPHHSRHKSSGKVLEFARKPQRLIQTTRFKCRSHRDITAAEPWRTQITRNPLRNSAKNVALIEGRHIDSSGATWPTRCYESRKVTTDDLQVPSSTEGRLTQAYPEEPVLQQSTTRRQVLYSTTITDSNDDNDDDGNHHTTTTPAVEGTARGKC